MIHLIQLYLKISTEFTLSNDLNSLFFHERESDPSERIADDTLCMCFFNV